MSLSKSACVSTEPEQTRRVMSRVSGERERERERGGGGGV